MDCDLISRHHSSTRSLRISHSRVVKHCFIKMFSKLTAFAKGLLAGQVVDNHLNPLHLAIATTGYHIQSNILHIPNRFGIFSTGHPRLQVHEATAFIVLVFATCFSLLSGFFVVSLFKLLGLPKILLIRSGAAMLSMTVIHAVCLWILACCGRHRSPGYDWGDWKLRTD